MNLLNVLKASFALVAVLCYAACVHQKEAAGTSQLGPAIHTPFKSVSPEKFSFTYHPEEEQTFKIASGTNIKIPAYAFVDQSGALIKTEVTVNYSEYHDPADIILSGIRMTTFDGNQIQHFESAGMFKIEAESSGSLLELASGKSIQVDLASSKNDTDFKNWFLNQETGNWEELGLSQAFTNVEKTNIEESIKQLQNTEIEKPEIKSKFYIDFSRLRVQNYSANALSEVIWEYAPANKSTELNPEENQWIFDELWQQTTLTGENDGIHFKASLVGNNKTFNTRLKPANGDNKAIKTALEEYKKYIDERNKQLADAASRYERMRNFQRSFSIANMGFYNCDRYYQMPNVIAKKVKMTLDGQDVESSCMIYQVCNNNAVIQLYANQAELKFGANESVKFLLVDINKNIATISNKEFEKLKPKQASTINLDFKSTAKEESLSAESFASLIKNL